MINVDQHNLQAQIERLDDGDPDSMGLIANLLRDVADHIDGTQEFSATEHYGAAAHGTPDIALRLCLHITVPT